jgi:hypothetical protein
MKALKTLIIAVVVLLMLYACFTIAIPIALNALSWLLDLAARCPAVRWVAGAILAAAFVLATCKQ